MSDLAILLPYPVRHRIILTPSLMIATLNFHKRLGHPNDAVAILGDLVKREGRVAFDWLRAGVEDGGEGLKGTWVYYLRVPKKIVDAVTLSGDVDAVAHAYSTACATIQTHRSTTLLQ